MHLGKYLLENRIVTPGQLEDALQLQVACGGRLGTNLVELGHLSVEELGRHLSEHTGLPLPPSEWVESPQPEALKAASLELVRRHKILPLQIEGQTLHVAMLDPLDPPQMDEVAFATGFRLKPYVLPEVAVFFWLERHLGVPREIRYIDVTSTGAEARVEEREQPGRDGTSETPQLASPAAQAMAALGVRPLGMDEELLDERTFSELQTAMFEAPTTEVKQPEADSRRETGQEERAPGFVRPASELLSPSRPSSRQQTSAAARVPGLEADLHRAPDRQAVAEAAIRLACAYVPVAALFIIHRGMIVGVCARGGKLDRRIGALMLPSEAKSVFAATAAMGEPIRLAPPKSGIDARLLDALGRKDVRQLAVLPIRIRDRVVNLLYVDNGSAEIGDTTFAALHKLCECTCAAYERLIRVRKQRFSEGHAPA